MGGAGSVQSQAAQIIGHISELPDHLGIPKEQISAFLCKCRQNYAELCRDLQNEIGVPGRDERGCGFRAAEHFEAFQSISLQSVAFFCAAAGGAQLSAERMPSQIHEGARPSRLTDRSAARHRRGLGRPQNPRDQDVIRK